MTTGAGLLSDWTSRFRQAYGPDGEPINKYGRRPDAYKMLRRKIEPPDLTEVPEEPSNQGEEAGVVSSTPDLDQQNGQNLENGELDSNVSSDESEEVSASEYSSGNEETTDNVCHSSNDEDDEDPAIAYDVPLSPPVKVETENPAKNQPGTAGEFYNNLLMSAERKKKLTETAVDAPSSPQNSENKEFTWRRAESRDFSDNSKTIEDSNVELKIPENGEPPESSNELNAGLESTNQDESQPDLSPALIPVAPQIPTNTGSAFSPVSSESRPLIQEPPVPFIHVQHVNGQAEDVSEIQDNEEIQPPLNLRSIQTERERRKAEVEQLVRDLQNPELVDEAVSVTDAGPSELDNVANSSDHTSATTAASDEKETKTREDALKHDVEEANTSEVKEAQATFAASQGTSSRITSRISKLSDDSQNSETHIEDKTAHLNGTASSEKVSSDSEVSTPPPLPSSPPPDTSTAQYAQIRKRAGASAQQSDRNSSGSLGASGVKIPVFTQSNSLRLNKKFPNYSASSSPGVMSPQSASSSSSKASGKINLIIGTEIRSFIDLRQAGPGKLRCWAFGQQKRSFCELQDNRNGTFILFVRPQETGRHVLNVTFDNEHIPGSPFNLYIMANPRPASVEVSGPALQDNIWTLYKSQFSVKVRDASAGQLSVGVQGPRGSYAVQLLRDGYDPRTIHCSFTPSGTGNYVIHVQFGGAAVPGSPFCVHVAETLEKLHTWNMYIKERNQIEPETALSLPPSKSRPAIII